VKPEEEMLRAAATRQERRTRRGRYEDPLAMILRECRGDVIQQRAVGHYNIDVALDEARVAVEVQGSKITGKSCTNLAHRAERILNAGWTMIFGLWWDAPPDIAACAEYIVALAERASGDESLRGRYGVIGSDGQPLPGTRLKLDHLPAIPSA
jgi:very-short-patch-repair endonuclease